MELDSIEPEDAQHAPRYEHGQVDGGGDRTDEEDEDTMIQKGQKIMVRRKTNTGILREG